MKLLSMTDFVLEQEKGLENLLDEKLPIIKTISSYDKIVKYANFLKQPLKLEMFVPCDEDGNVLKPVLGKNTEYYFDKEFKKSKEKVLFEGFTFKEETKDSYFLLEEGIYTHVLTKIFPRTIENLVGMDKLTLTESALKQLGL